MIFFLPKGLVVCGLGDYLILPVEPSQEEALVTMTMDFSLLKRVFPPEQRPIWSVTMPLAILSQCPRKSLLERFSPSIRAN